MVIKVCEGQLGCDSTLLDEAKGLSGLPSFGQDMVFTAFSCQKNSMTRQSWEFRKADMETNMSNRSREQLVVEAVTDSRPPPSRRKYGVCTEITEVDRTAT